MAIKRSGRLALLAWVAAGAATLAGAADSETPARATLAVEIESLRARVAQQEAVIRRLEAGQQSRTDLVAQQQRLITAMEKKLQHPPGPAGPARAETAPLNALPPSLPLEIESLRARVAEQEAVLRRFEKALGPQGELIVEQQRLIEALRQKVEAISAAPPPPAAAPAASPEAPRPAGATPTFSGMLQGWFASGNGGFRDTFRLRRGELKGSGQVSPDFKWTVMIDVAKALSVSSSTVPVEGRNVLSDTTINQAGRILQDAFITVSSLEKLRVDVGQFKVPLSLEGLQSSSTLETAERALFCSDRARGGSLGDVRDIGAVLWGPLTRRIDYRIGLFNGSGESQNDVDRNDQKVVAGRLVVRPLKGLQVGASSVWGNGERADRPRRDRLGAELLFTRGAFKAKGEWMTGRDADLERRGYYALFAYAVRPRLEAVVRFDAWDPDTRFETSANNVEERDYLGGFNYHVSQNRAKVQVNYVHKTYANEVVPARRLVLVNLQASW
jgi:uncharacterized coiled-coil protein SlyX